jgi:hypothetical protein
MSGDEREVFVAGAGAARILSPCCAHARDAAHARTRWGRIRLHARCIGRSIAGIFREVFPSWILRIARR